MKVGSLFAGIGGFDLAFRRAGFTTAWMVENDPQCQAVLRKRFPNAEVYGDVREVKAMQAVRGGEAASGVSSQGGHEGRAPGLVQEVPEGIRSSQPEGGDAKGGDTRTAQKVEPVPKVRTEAEGCGRNEAEADGRVRDLRTSNGEGLRGSQPRDGRSPGALVPRVQHQTPGGGGRDVPHLGAGILKPVDVITAGFPCQDLSVAGQRRGLKGGRSGLFFEIIRLVEEMREETEGVYPAVVVLENVPGLLSSNGGKDFAVVLAELANVGALDIGWRVLDSQFFGVPQRRRRMFVVADFRGKRASEILALSEGLFGHPAPSREAGEELAGSLGGSSEPSGKNRYDLDNHGAYPLAFNWQNACGYGNAHDGLAISVDHAGPLDRSQTKAVVTAIPRRLTPRECERLQGFPDDWTQVEYNGKPMADGPRYRMMGNAVTVNVVEWIGRRIMETLRQEIAENR